MSAKVYRLFQMATDLILWWSVQRLLSDRYVENFITSLEVLVIHDELEVVEQMWHVVEVQVTQRDSRLDKELVCLNIVGIFTDRDVIQEEVQSVVLFYEIVN